MNFDPHAYTITTRKITEDGESVFKATVLELPHLATYEDSAEAAYQVLVEDISALHEMSEKLGHAFPEPIGEPSGEYTGRVTLRLPRTLHHRLADVSRQEDVSLNTCLVALLSEAVSSKQLVASVTNSIQSSVRAAILGVQLVEDAIQAEGKPTASYSSTAQIELPIKEETWTKFH